MAFLSDINALTKKIYKKGGVTKLVPEESYNYLVRNIPFKPSHKLGEKYVESFELSLSGGFTFGDGQSRVTLNDAASMKLGKAEIPAKEIILTDDILISELKAAYEAGEKAFEKVVGLTKANMLKSMHIMLESQFIYGQYSKGLGTVEVDSAVELTSTTAEFVITEATFAEGLWALKVGFSIDIYNGTDADILNSNAALVITKVDIENRKITVSGNASDIDALVQDATTDDHSDLYVQWRGTRAASDAWSEQAGLLKQITNTGDLFGINAGTYEAFRGLDESDSGEFSYDMIMSQVAKLVGRGCMENLVVLCHPKAWQKVASANAAQQNFVSENKKQVKGAEKLAFKGINGEVEIVPHPLMQQSLAIVMPKDAAKRIGAGEIDFTAPGADAPEFYKPGRANYLAIDLYCHEVLFVCKPNVTCVLSGFSV